MPREPQPIVFSDVESLLEPAACLPDEVVKMRQAVKAQGLPLILCSTRTRAELEFIRRRFGLRHPFICENGAAVCVPSGYFDFELPSTRRVSGYDVVEYGRPYAEVVEALHDAADRLGVDVVGFRDLSVEDVADDCRLTLQQARLAKLREYGEPFRIVSHQPNQRIRLFRALATSGFGCAAGGRYDYVGAAADEVIGIRLLCESYQRMFGRVLTIGLGDPVRDSGLLQHVQVPIAVRRDDAESPRHLIMKRPAARPLERPAAGVAGGWRRTLSQLARRVTKRVGSSVLSRLDSYAANH